MRNVRALFLAIGVLLYSRSDAQCLELYRSLETRTVASSLITEAKVLSSTTRWNEDKTLILTEYQLDVHKVLKGNAGASSLMVVSIGGFIGDTGLITSSYVPLQIGDYGIFFLNDYNNQIYLPDGQQSLIRFQQNLKTAYDALTTYPNINKNLYKPISRYSGQSIKVVKVATPVRDNAQTQYRENGEAGIDAFYPTTITPGTLDTLTIKGEGFGASRCSNCYVNFKNADSPTSYMQVGASYYTSWTDTMIKLIVPGNGVGYTPGSGNFYVTTESGQQLNAPSGINMPFSVLNNYVGSSLNRVVLVGDNASNGYTLTLDNNIATNPDAVEAFKRAVQSWRCNAGINFEIDANTSNVTCPVKDNINSISFAKPGCSFPASPLAQTMIWYSCKYITEVDIVFSTNYTFDYKKGSTPSSQYDFESVSLHELGHAFGLGHVIGNGRVMHPTLQNGAEVTTMASQNEIAAASSMIAHSSQNTCSQNVYNSINNNCSIMPPSARFGVNINNGCAPMTVQFIDSTSGGATSYAWDMNNDGITDYTTATPKHTFNTQGQYTIKLTASNSNGSSTYTFSNLTVKPTPNLVISGQTSHSICEGGTQQLAASINTTMNLQWKRNGVNIAGATGLTYYTTQDGNYTLTATAANCPATTSLPVSVAVIPKPVASLEFKNDTLFCFPTNMEKYVWIRDNAALEGESKSYIVTNMPGNYKAMVSNQNGCSDTTNAFGYKITAVSEQATDDIIQVYPNPASQVLNINIGNYTSNKTNIRIVDLLGANVYERTGILTSKGDNVEVPVASLAPGMYILQLEGGEKAYTKKFIKN